MPTAARLKLEFEQGPCPHCGAPLELEFGKPLQPRTRDLVEFARCHVCGGEIVSETRGSRFWYTPEEFAKKEVPARRLVRSSRQWFALTIELHLAAMEVVGADAADLSRQFERADAALREALEPALKKARAELSAEGCESGPPGR